MGTPKSKAKPKAKPAAEPKRGRGRPTVYAPHCAEVAKRICESGGTDVDVAAELKIDRATLYRWRHSYPEFCDALKVGKHALDERVISTLAHRALGYTFESEEIHVIEGKVVRVPIVKHLPPDPTSMIFWLKNRRPAEFRDRQEQVRLDLHMSLAELVNLSFRPDLPEPKVIEHDPEEK